MKKINKKAGKIFIGVILTVTLVYFLISKIDLTDIINTIKSISPTTLFFSFIIYLSIYILRTLRFKILLDNKLKFKELFPIVCVHNFLNSILPARMGELAYPALLKKYKRINYSTSLGGLVIVRVFDFISISSVFLISTLFLSGETSEIVQKFIYIIAFFTLLLLTFFIFLMIKGEFIYSIIIKIFSKLHLTELKMVRRLTSFLERFLRFLSAFKVKRSILQILILSLLVNLFMFSLGFVILRGMGSTLPVWEIFVGGTLALFTTVLPVQSVLGFGTMEVGWVVAFVAVGMPQAQAITTGFSWHIINIIFLFMLGIFGFIRIKLNNFEKNV